MRVELSIGDRVYHKNYGYGNVIDILCYSYDVLFDIIGKRIVPTNELEMVKDAKEMTSYKVGDRVEHEKFGKGTVKELSMLKGYINVHFDKDGPHEEWTVLTSHLTKIEETKDMITYNVGDIVEHPLYNESIIIDISRFSESGHIKIVPLTGFSRGLPVLVRINNVKPVDDKLIISVKDYNKMNNEIERLRYMARNKAASVSAAYDIKLALNSFFGTRNLPGIKEVLYRKPVTIIFWEDGTKTVVKTQNKEKYDKEKGFVMACLKKILGNKGNYYEVIKKWTEED